MNQKQDRKNLESGELAVTTQENEKKIIYWPPKSFYSNAQDANKRRIHGQNSAWQAELRKDNS